MDRFVHLEVQSAFSFLWGAFSPEDLVKEAVSLGQKAVALTDYGLHGAVPFYKAATAAGIQPIIGAKITIWDGSPITLLASDFRSYGNLCRLVSIALDDSMLPRVALTKQDLKHRSRGLICLAGGMGSRTRSWLEKGRREAARLCLLELREVLHNPDRLFVVLQNHDPGHDASRPLSAEAHAVLEETADLAAGLNLPVVATNAVTFLRREDYVVHRTLVGI